MLIPSAIDSKRGHESSLSRRVNANSQPLVNRIGGTYKLIKKGEC